MARKVASLFRMVAEMVCLQGTDLDAPLPRAFEWRNLQENCKAASEDRRSSRISFGIKLLIN